MKYSTAIMLAVGVFLVIGYFVYIGDFVSPQAPPPSSDGASAFPEIVFIPNSTTTNSTTSAISLPARTPPIGTKEYTNTDYGFSFLLPRDLTVSTFDEGGGATTITFQNVEKAEGFQLFITPYGESQVSEKRFTLDVPSGIRESVTPVVIDGATGAAFYSSNSALGATREVWVVHGGFLYEATTLKPLDAWLDTIIQTWRFI